MTKKSLPPAPDGYRYIFRTWKKGPDGRIMHASAYGLKAWPILVPL